MDAQTIEWLFKGGGIAWLLSIVGFIGGIYFKAGKAVAELRDAKSEALKLRGELHQFAGKIEGKMDNLTIVLSGVESRVSVLEAVVRIKDGSDI